MRTLTAFDRGTHTGQFTVVGDYKQIDMLFLLLYNIPTMEYICIREIDGGFIRACKRMEDEAWGNLGADGKFKDAEYVAIAPG